ncbi:hypothetical protein [Brevundimonas diminuta]|uniref:hypothetical protein n=1 Tax=Brevundimonas diminuta TaxID=293 RepID=UPI0030FA8A97
MISEENFATPWFPVPEIPKTGCEIEIEAIPGWVTIRAAFSFYEGNRDLIIEIRPIIAAIFEESASPHVNFPPNYPLISGYGWENHAWPIMKVKNSSWIKENKSRLLLGVDYEHIHIVSGSGSFDIITSEMPENVEWVEGRGQNDYVPHYRR